MTTSSLARLVRSAAMHDPDGVAVHGADGPLTYSELCDTADRAAAALRELGVAPGDRVALWAEKSARLVAVMQGVLRAGAAYVPIDPTSPEARAGIIARDCSVKVVVTSAARAAKVRAVLGPNQRLLLLDESDAPGAALSWSALRDMLPSEPAETKGDALAYILYTSGSTGVPKGVCISHRNALAFVNWAALELNLVRDDRLSNHAPFHFDLSVFDLYGAFHAGASVHLINEVDAHVPRQLTRFIAERRISVWYSVPSVLTLLLDRGDWMDAPPHSLRAVVFAGEVFPLPHLRRLRAFLPSVRLLNLYGPTETNVCTWYEVPAVGELDRPIPIGHAASGDEVWARRADGGVAQVGEEGELVVEGPTVMLGYWGRPPQGSAPYATGDIVRVLADHSYHYVGRRDHMLKIRGNRVEPAEIEARLHAHPQVREAAVVASGSGPHAQLVAFIVPGASEAPTLLAIKHYLAGLLPKYMIVDQVRILEELPRTSNDKVDRMRLCALVEA